MVAARYARSTTGKFPTALRASDSDFRSYVSAIGEVLEPDFLLLKPDEAGEMKLLAGCVCFPSSWSLEEKMGRPLDFIHRVVPGLNEQLGKPIAQFCRRMTPDIAWLRANWGLSRSPELNQHPRRALPRLDATVKPDEVWLRVEHQALVALPRTGGLLFGMRVIVHSLAEVKRNPAAAHGLHHALQTMPEAMAVYKGIAPARTALLEMLEASGPQEPVEIPAPRRCCLSVLLLVRFTGGVAENMSRSGTKRNSNSRK